MALDTPSRSTGIYISGGVMAAPTVGAVMEEILPYLEVKRNYGPEDAAGKAITVEDLTGLTLAEAKKQLKALGLTAETVGSGPTVTAQIPTPGSVVPGDSQILLYFGTEPERRTAVVPDFIGMTPAQASAAAGRLGLYILLSGNDDPKAVVTAQSHLKETQVPAGTTIRLILADPKAAD